MFFRCYERLGGIFFDTPHTYMWSNAHIRKYPLSSRGKKTPVIPVGSISFSRKEDIRHPGWKLGDLRQLSNREGRTHLTRQHVVVSRRHQQIR